MDISVRILKNRLSEALLACIPFSLIVGSLMLSPAAWGAESSSASFEQRGVLLYLPFDGSLNAEIAHGSAEPWVSRNITFVEGRACQAVRLRGASGPQDRDASMLHYNGYVRVRAGGSEKREGE